jgi:predicted Zn-dependent protease with MMP-like domain
MRETIRAPLRAAATSALVVGLLLFLLNPPELSGAEDLLTLLMGALALVLFTAWVTVALMGEGPSEEEIDRLVRRSEMLATLPPAERAPTEFDELVIAAVDDLPEEFQDALRDVPIVVSHLGREHSAYGHYMGDTVARDNYPDRIVVYQDTLERDFGHDQELLKAQVERTVRHELAHHLGWNEPGVRGLGL